MSKFTEEIKKALDEASPQPWREYKGLVCEKGTGNAVCAVYGGTINMDDKNDQNVADSHLISNAPTWLSQLLQEREQMVEALKECAAYADKDASNFALKLLREVGESE